MLRQPPWLQVLLVLPWSPFRAPQLCVLSLWWQTTLRLRPRAHGTCPTVLHLTSLCVRGISEPAIPFKEFYDIPETETVVHGTLRYQSFPEFIKTLKQLRWLDTVKKEWLKNGSMWAEATQSVIGANEAKEGYVLLTRPLDQLNLA